MVDVVHQRLMAVEEALRSILAAENRGKDRKSAETVATMVLDENMTYSDAVMAVAERADPRRAFYEGAGVPDPEVAEEAAEEPAEEPEKAKPRARAKAKA